jgi:CheY-like chemotaxis protein
MAVARREAGGGAWTGRTALIGATAAAYFAAASLGLRLAFEAEQVTLVWPTTGVALAALLLFGRAVWPGVVLGALLRVADAAAPDVILSDLGLPGMDGYELARKLRARPAFGRVVLVALSGYGRDEDRQRASEGVSTTTWSSLRTSTRSCG